MGPELTQVGVGGVLAILIVREVLNFLRTRNGKDNPGHDNPGHSCGFDADCKALLSEQVKLLAVRDSQGRMVGGLVKDIESLPTTTAIAIAEALADLPERVAEAVVAELKE